MNFVRKIWDSVRIAFFLLAILLIISRIPNPEHDRWPNLSE